MNGLEAEFAGDLVVLRLDILTQAGREAAVDLGSTLTPTFIFYDAGGEERWRAFGSLDPGRVRAELQPAEE